MLHRWMILLLLFLCTGCAVNSGSDSAAIPAPTAEAAGPLHGITVLVDPGHGGYDGGARCVDSGVWEKTVNLRMGLAIEQELMRRGARVVMTRREDVDLCSEPLPAGKTKKRQDMERRVAMAVEQQADLVLSVHMNEYRMRSESGPQVFYRQGCEGGRLLAGCLQDALIRTLQPTKQRSSMAGDFFILQLDTPSVLIECGFISNSREEALLLRDDYQAMVAMAVADGAEDYLRLSGRIP